ncbi:MAG TPA: type I secretion C-terminal target domain-containing protein, partial [Methylotenera sp.]|nr:type I secretion C-terminal target domain-containing protein [Methylotenera sp.]
TAGNTITFNIGTVLTVSDPLPVDEGRAGIFVVELSAARAVNTVINLTPGGEATSGTDYSATLQYRIQDPTTNVYSAWTNYTGSLTMLAGQTRLEVKVLTTADLVENELESLTLTASIGNYAQTDMTNISAVGQTVITDSPSLLMSGPSYVSEGGIAVFDLELSAIKSTDTLVNLRFEGVATLGASNDFEYSIDGGTTWISLATSSITIAGDALANPTAEVWVRTRSDAVVEIDEIFRLVASTDDTGISNRATDVSSDAYIVDPIVASGNEDTGILISSPAGYTVSLLGQGAHGTVVDNGNGTLTYTPSANYSGADSFTITKTNAVGNSVTSIVNMTVAAVADAPTVTISVSDLPLNGMVGSGNVVVNGDFSSASTGWTSGASGGGGATFNSSTLVLVTGNGQPTHTAFAQQTITGLTSGQSYTFTVNISTAPTTGNGLVRWNGTAIAPTSYSGGVATFTVSAAASNTLTFTSPATKSASITVDNVSLITSTVLNYTYTVDVSAALVDTDGSETLGNNIVIASSNLPTGAVLKLSDGTVVADTNATAAYTWTMTRAQASGLLLTVNKSVGTQFTLTAAATSAEGVGGSTATGTATTATITMPATGTNIPNEVPLIGNSDITLSNEANFVGTVTETISTQFGDGTNTLSWVSVADSLPNIYAGGELVVYTLTISPDGLTGTVTGSTSAGAIFELVIQLNTGADADVTYTQYQSLLGSEIVGSGESMVMSGGNGQDLTLTFDAGGIPFDVVVTGENYLDGTTTTINTNNKYIGAANNLMNAGERVTLDFASGTTGNAVALMQVSFFNFDSASEHDELTIYGTTVDGSQFSYYVTNASLDANGMYSIVAPGGELIEKLIFEAGSQSSYKLGIENVSVVDYDANFDLQLSYQLTDADGDSATGTISLTLDGDNSIIGTTGDDVLLGGSANDAISGDAGADVISGGGGNDALTGGLGTDVFQWALADAGTSYATRAQDTVTGFGTTAGTDVLDLRDLLTGENSGNLQNYLHFASDGAGGTIVHISTSGGFSADGHAVGGAYTSANETQQITLSAADLIGSNTTDAQIIANLLANNKLITD